MVAVDAPGRVNTPSQSRVEIKIDLGLLRNWGNPGGHCLALGELQRVETELVGRGVRERSAHRIVSALARYAFLVSGDCDPAHGVLWRLHAIDAVPADVLATLTWDQVRPHLREVVVGSPGECRYFDLSLETSRMLKRLRSLRRRRVGIDRVFCQVDGAPWDGEHLAHLLARITAR